MAAAAGCLAATAVAWIALGKPDLSMILNGTLAGLVAVTAPCYWIGTGSSIVIGLIAGVLVVYAVIFFDKVKVDDPVGALSVHLVNGVWGTLSVGLFASRNDVTGLFYGGGLTQLLIQAKGVLAVGVFVAATAALAWFLIKMTLGIRVSAEEELEGLDKGEHGIEAYPGFATTTTASTSVV
jgi:Amt family ammonium transporter